MNLRDLSYLVAVADHRHFGRAAQACYISQPTLSTQIKKLERELGVALVERSSRRILLTPAGEQVVARARGVLSQVDDIHRVAAQARDPEAGSIRLGLFPTLAPYLLPHVVPGIHTRFPHLELLLVEEKTEVILTQLRSGQLDAGVLALPVNHDGLCLQPLFTEDFVLAVPATHPLAAVPGQIDRTGPAWLELLVLEEVHCRRDQALEVCQLAGAGEKSGFRATSLETLRQMVAANVGITLLPVLAVKPPVARVEQVRRVEFLGRPPARHIAMLCRKRAALHGFLGSLAELFRQLPDGLLDPGIDPT